MIDNRPLGRTATHVPNICLGTMTWGSEQNTREDGFAQMDRALAAGVTFFDTAELYAVPPRPETCHSTETIIGDWLATRKCRDKIYLASKIVGLAPHIGWVRDGRSRPDRINIRQALDGSLNRLRTDWIDLYQVHWPGRVTNTFGQRGYQHKPGSPHEVPILETLEALGEEVKAGRIRHIGLSNETPWGVMEFVRLAEQFSLPRVVTVQNAYNLLNRSFESTLAEIAAREDIGLLAYAPLAAGTLSGKYLDGQMPPGTRRAVDYRASRYETVNGDAATRAYLEVAARHGLEPTQMALAFVNSRPFVTSTIIGATRMDQLERNLAAFELRLSDEVLADLEAVQARYPDPCP